MLCFYLNVLTFLSLFYFRFFPHTHITCKKHSLSIITPKALLSPLLGCWFICQSILPNCFSPALNELFCSKSPLNLFCWSKPRFSNNWTVEWFNEFPFSRWKAKRRIWEIKLQNFYTSRSRSGHQKCLKSSVNWLKLSLKTLLISKFM